MPWYAWAIIAYTALQALLHVAMVGKSTKITAGGAVLAVVTAALLIWAVVVLGQA